IAFQCVTGELPYDSEGVGDLLIKITIGDSPVPSRVYPGVPANFDAWFAKACARDPAKRFQSAREMAVALAGVVGVVDGTAPRSPTMRPPAASRPALGGASLPRPPRAATEQLEIGDWEEIDPFDEDEEPVPAAAPSPAKAAPFAAPGKPSNGSSSKQQHPSRPAPAPAPPRPAAPSPDSAAPPRPALKAPRQGRTASPIREEPRAPPPEQPDSPRPAMESHEGHDIVDFDETIPVTDNRPSLVLPLLVRAHVDGAAEPPAPALTPLSEPPRAAAGPDTP